MELIRPSKAESETAEAETDNWPQLRLLSGFFDRQLGLSSQNLRKPKCQMVSRRSQAIGRTPTALLLC